MVRGGVQRWWPARALSTFEERQMSPLVLARRFRKIHVLFFPAWHSFSWLSRLAKRLMTDQVEAVVFGVYLGSGAMLGCLAVRVEWFALSASCMSRGALGVALPLFRFSPGFPLINRAVRVIS
jgi:hypothetical protein